MSAKDYDADALRRSFQMIGLDYAAPSPTNPPAPGSRPEFAPDGEIIQRHAHTNRSRKTIQQ